VDKKVSRSQAVMFWKQISLSHEKDVWIFISLEIILTLSA